jgi:rSAM/selenodomain-associated transferase 1
VAGSDVTERRAILVVAKAPEPGRTKTRLCPPLSLEDAAALYQAFLIDTTAAALALGWERVTLVHPNQAKTRHVLAGLVPGGAELQPQRGAGLGAALSSAFESHLGAGFGRVILIGSDSPSLPSAFIQDACSALDHCDVVIGPSADGGYYLIGMRTFYPSLFTGISWSTDRVHEQTLARARALPLRVWSLPEWYDVDTVVDLRRLVADLEQLPNDIAPLTRAQLAKLARLAA